MIWAIVVFVESHVASGIDYSELAKAVGFSMPHLRSVFARHTGRPLSRYITGRKISRAAFDIVHSDNTLSEIAGRYGFLNPDTFTRAFRRITGINPSDFRKIRPSIGRIKLCAGVYGVSAGCKESGKNPVMERIDHMPIEGGKQKISGESGVLYGVPRVHYGAFGGCTPYPICLKAVANYMGIHLEYEDAIVQCGAAFRLVWDTTAWNGGNVDVLLAFDDPTTVFKSGIEALGYEFLLLGRDGAAKAGEPGKYAMAEDSKNKSKFIAFIKESIDKGVPVIALGVIGPPEACVIAGYRDSGETLLGWDCFQDSPEFAPNVTTDESGYFITSEWWENRNTVAVMTLGEKIGEPEPLVAIVKRAIAALTGRQCGKYAKGIAAYDAWKKSILDETQFSGEMVFPLQVERLMCQGDAMDCLSDGRKNACKYFSRLAGDHPGQPLFGRLAEQFAASATAAHQMYETLGGWERGEAQLKALMRPDIRRRLGELIDACKAADEKALLLLKEISAY